MGDRVLGPWSSLALCPGAQMGSVYPPWGPLGVGPGAIVFPRLEVEGRVSALKSRF